MFQRFKKSQKDVIDYGDSAMPGEWPADYRGVPEPVTPSGEFPAVRLTEIAIEFPAVVFD